MPDDRAPEPEYRWFPLMEQPEGWLPADHVPEDYADQQSTPGHRLWMRAPELSAEAMEAADSWYGDQPAFAAQAVQRDVERESYQREIAERAAPRDQDRVAEREAQIRADIQTMTSNESFQYRVLLRLLDEARASGGYWEGIAKTGAGEVRERDEEIARLQAPPGASAMERADRAIDDALAEAKATGDVVRLRYWFSRHVEQAEAKISTTAIDALTNALIDPDTKDGDRAGLGLAIIKLGALAKPQGQGGQAGPK